MRDAQLHAHSSDLKGSITPPASVGFAAAIVVLALAAAAITVPADVGLVLAVVAEAVLFREVSARDGPLAIFALARVSWQKQHVVSAMPRGRLWNEYSVFSTTPATLVPQYAHLESPDAFTCSFLHVASNAASSAACFAHKSANFLDCLATSFWRLTSCSASRGWGAGFEGLRAFEAGAAFAWVGAAFSSVGALHSGDILRRLPLAADGVAGSGRGSVSTSMDILLDRRYSSGGI